MAEIPFPGGAADQDVFFHEDKVCIYHKSINTWECRTFGTSETGTGSQVVTTRTVQTIPIPPEGVRDDLLPDLRTQYDVNWYLADKVDNLEESTANLKEDTYTKSQVDTFIANTIHLSNEGDKDIRENHGLEEVLKAGNISDKSIVLTNAENDALLLSPDEARVMVGGFGDGVVPAYELRHTNSFQESSVVKLELDDDGKRFDIECDERAENIHFRFNEEAKLDINKTGDAVFAGKVQGEPGTQNNEFVTYGQLLTVEEELEQLAPSLERGTWNFTLNHPPGVGEYCMISGFLTEDDQRDKCTEEYMKCYTDAAGDAAAQSECNRLNLVCENAVDGDLILTTDKWEECDQLVFNNTDAKGVIHNWQGIDSDHFIDLFNEADDGFMIGDVTTHGGGTFSFDLVSSKGSANGLASLKIFRTEGSIDFDNYARKTYVDDNFVKLVSDSGFQTIRGASGYTNVLKIQPSGNSNSVADIFTIKDNQGGSLFTVGNDKTVRAGTKESPIIASQPHHLITKSAGDVSYGGPARFAWTFNLNNTSSPVTDTMCNYSTDRIKNKATFRFSLKPREGPIFQNLGRKVVYNYSTTNQNMNLTLWYWDYAKGSWKWKGSGPVEELNLEDGYIYCKLGNNTNYESGMVGAIYYVTISGFF